jgi:hypothetical protein
MYKAQQQGGANNTSNPQQDAASNTNQSTGENVTDVDFEEVK